ncbi:MAG: cell wall metabolism sensor histidine kinase WalK [Clostridiales Family XIII bacterium]|jgi:two-component system sensor histidine kinase VicK|nr:cell wall metabolism sensor histidine kinase WalK [Clostridiales Family XIII bacterium]
MEGGPAVKIRWNSIRWRIVFIYFLLVFIATTIIGVFIMSQLEAYHNDSVSGGIRNTVKEGGLLASLEEYDSLSGRKAEIQNNIDAWARNTPYDIFVVDVNWDIVAATTEYGGASAHGILSEDLLFKGFKGESAEYDSTYSEQNEKIPSKSITFPIENHSGKITGVLYMRADITSIYKAVSEAKLIFVRAMIIALAITVVLGFLIARSITGPINDVTEKAEKMARGDFSQEVSVKSDDEIGRFADMFNLLRVRLNQTLSEISSEKNKLETILRYMADGLIAIDLDGNIMHANPASREMLKISEDDVTNRRYDEIIGKYTETLLLEKIKANCEQEAATETFVHGGAVFAVRYGRFKDENRRDIGVIMILQDITEQQKLEDMQSDFVANVSHELKTPITTIKSYTETLIEHGIGDEKVAVDFLKIIDAEADRMNRIVKDLLQLSRLDHKQEKWHKKERNLIALLQSAVKKMEMTAAGKNQYLNCIFRRDGVLLADIDRDRIEQVILNVLSNAIKYTGERGRIDIDAAEAGRMAQIIISDNGIGIPESELSRVFERFFRVDKARSRSAGGTGLGLSISKQIVEEHRGGIEIESKEGKGTKVTINLPAAPIRGQRNIE